MYSDIDTQILNIINNLEKEDIRPTIPKITTQLSELIYIMPSLLPPKLQVVLKQWDINKNTPTLRVDKLVSYRLISMGIAKYYK